MSGAKVIAQFDISYTQFLDPEGKIIQALPEFAQNTEHLKTLYRAMVKTRVFDSKAIALQRTGKIGTYPSTLGQEAIGVGMGAAMSVEDVLCPYYREQGAQFWRGVSMLEILLYWGGDERGSDFQSDKVKQDFPICVPIASQTLHAVGIATAFKLREEARVAVVAVGDGGTSRGDFYEAVNVAGAWHLPVVFIINNNQWAISVPRKNQTAAKTLAQKGIAGGIHSEQVDGNDVIAVEFAVSSAIARARAGQGPSLIEAITYRMCDHTTADDAKRYRKEEELKTHQKEDPLTRLSRYLTHINAWDETQEQQLQKEASAEVLAAVQEYEKFPKRTPASMFDHLYESLPEAYHAQRDEASNLKEISKHG